MAHSYSAENHDWDLTLRAAFELLQIGRIMDQQPRTGTLTKGFSALVGSMLLSFSSIESFSASVAFCMPETERFKDFDFEEYKRKQRFWDKIEMLFSATNQKVDKSGGLFQSISEMQRWRNLVTHASPYRIDPVEVSNTTSEPLALHKPLHRREYTRSVNVTTATKFYQSAFDYIEYLKTGSGLEPRAQSKYHFGSS